MNFTGSFKGTVSMSDQFAHARFALIPIVSMVLLTACGGGGGGGKKNGPAPSNLNNTWIIDPNLVIDAGPGPDGIPALENPLFAPIGTIISVDDDELVIAVQFGTETKVYPHDIMDYHEVVNDVSGGESFVMSYCPLTGTAIGWEIDQSLGNKTFGVSGLLYNSNLILYDRETASLWSQMLQVSINGQRVLERPQRYQVLETTKGTVKEMYPDAIVMTRDTGHDRQYQRYPYGSYKQSTSLLFPVENTDQRLHPKTRVLAVIDGLDRRAFQIQGFDATNHVINEQVGVTPMVIVGNSSKNFALAFERTMPDDVVLNFTAVDDPANPANILMDDEGNIWNSFGTAVSGPRAGARLSPANSYVAYWFAMAAFYEEIAVYFNPT
jgi:hypothetical protein